MTDELSYPVLNAMALSVMFWLVPVNEAVPEEAAMRVPCVVVGVVPSLVHLMLQPAVAVAMVVCSLTPFCVVELPGE